MQEIKCPNCGKVFQVDDTGYAQILSQIRDKEFEKELSRREQELKKKNESDMTIARMEQEKIHSDELSKKDEEIASKEREIERLNAQIEKADTEKKLAVSEALKDKELELSEKTTEITQLRNDLDLQKKRKRITRERAFKAARRRNKTP